MADALDTAPVAATPVDETDVQSTATPPSETPDFGPEDIPSLIKEPDFRSLPTDQQEQQFDYLVGQVTSGLKQQPDLKPEDWQNYGQLVDTARAKIAPSLPQKAVNLATGTAQAVGNLGKDVLSIPAAIPPAVQHPVDMAKTVGAAAASDVGGAATGVVHYVTRHIPGTSGYTLDSNVDDLKRSIDTGNFPLTDMNHQASWVRQQSDQLGPVQRAANVWDFAGHALASPKNAMLLGAYLHTRNPKIWAQLRRNLTTTRSDEFAQDYQNDVANSAGAQAFDTWWGKGAHEHLIAASDPTNLLFALRAAKVATTGGRLAKAVKFASEMSGFGALNAVHNDPGASLLDIGQEALKAILTGSVIQGGTHLGKKILKAALASKDTTESAASATAEASPRSAPAPILSPETPLGAAFNGAAATVTGNGDIPSVAPEETASVADHPGTPSLEAWADNAIKEGKSRLNSMPVDLLTAYAVKGAFHLARGLRDFTRWSARMLTDFGKAIQPHLQAIWDVAHSYLSDALQAARKTSEVGAVSLGGKSKGPAVRYSDDKIPALDKLRRWTGDQLLDLRLTAHDVVHGPKFTAFKAIWNRLNGEGSQANALATDALVEAIQKASGYEPILRMAWGPWREANGDAALLTQERNDLRKLPGKEWAVAIWDRAIKAATSSKDLSFFQQLNAIDDANLARGQKNNVLKQGIENHVSHLWDLPRDQKRPGALGSFVSKLAGQYKFGKERKIGSFYEGIKLGFRPKNMDAADVLGLQTYEMNKTIATRRFFHDSLRTRMEDGRPIAALLVGRDTAARVAPHLAAASPDAAVIALPTTSDGRLALDATGTQPEIHDITDYTVHEIPSMKDTHFVAPDENGNPIEIYGNLAWHPETQKFIQNRLGRSRWKDVLNEQPNSVAGYVVRKGVAGLATVNGGMKQALLGLIGIFHLSQEIFHGAGHWALSPLKNSLWHELKAPDYSNPKHVDAMNHGLQVAGSSEAMKVFAEGFDSPLLQKIPGIGPLIRIQSQWLFHVFIPALKLKTYLEALERNLATYDKEIQNGKMTVDDVKYLTAKIANAGYGELNYHDMGRSRGFQDLLRAVLLAPDFLEARTKFFGNAVQGALGLKHGREAIKTCASLAILTYVTARIINGVLNDGDTKAEEWFNVRYGNRRYSMRNVVTDAVEAFADTRKFVRGRMSPAFQIEEMAREGMNYRGEHMTAGDIAKEALMRGVPMQAQALPWVRNLTDTGANNPVSPWEQLMGTLGVHVNRYSPITDAHKLATQWRASNDPNFKAQGTYPVSIYTKLRMALEDADPQRSLEEYRALLSPDRATQVMGALEGHDARHNPASKIEHGLKESLFHPYTESKAMDRAWEKTLTPEQRQLVALSDQRKKDIWRRFTDLKAGHAVISAIATVH